MDESIKVQELNKRVSLYKPVSVPDGQGGFTEGDPLLVQTVWAKILKPKFWTVNAQSGPASAITQGIIIRHRTDITYGWRIQYNGMFYTILHIDYSSAAILTLTCQVVIHNG